MNYRFSIKEIREYFKKNGCRLLEKEYINCSTKMKYICICGKESSICLNSFKNGTRCGCARKTINLLNKDEIKKEVESKDYKFLSCVKHKKTYKITSICKKCKSKRTCTLCNFRSNGCRVCSRKIKKDKVFKKYDINSAKSIFEKSGCKLLDNHYENSMKSMNYVCCCGRKSKISLSSFLQGSRCKKCGIEKMIKNKFDVKKVLKAFKEAGCTLLEDYQKSSIPMKYICSCGRESKISWNNFSKGRRCNSCGISKRSKENHYCWNKDRKKHKDDLKFRQRCYKLVKMSLDATGRVKSKRTQELLGYSPAQLQEHITSHPNYKKLKGKSFHIDHIFPIKAFVDHNILDLSIINCLDNLRPLSGAENCGKNAKYDKKEFLEWLRAKNISF